MAPSGTVIWDAHTFRKLLALPGTGTPSTSVVWSPDGRQVLLEAGPGVEVRDASSGKLLRTLDTPGVAELAFSRDGDDPWQVGNGGPNLSRAGAEGRLSPGRRPGGAVGAVDHGVLLAGVALQRGQPAAVQAFAEESVAKTREAFSRMNATAKDNAKLIEEVVMAAQAGAKAIGEKVLNHTAANTEAAFDAAQAIARCRTLPEAARLQADYMQQQMAAVFVHQPMHHGQPHAAALPRRLGGKEGFENGAPHAFVDAGAVIRHAQHLELAGEGLLAGRT